MMQTKPKNIIINIKTLDELLALMPRIKKRGYLGIPSSVCQQIFDSYGDKLCLRLCENSGVYHDRISYYQREYSEFIISVDEYYKVYDHDYYRSYTDLNNKLIKAIKNVAGEIR